MNKYIVIVQSKIVEIDERVVIETLEKESVKTLREAYTLRRKFKKKYPDNKIIVFKHYLGGKWREVLK